MKGRFTLIIASILMIAGLLTGFLLLSKVYTGPAWVELVVLIIVVFVTICLIVALKRFFDATKEDK